MKRTIFSTLKKQKNINDKETKHKEEGTEQSTSIVCAPEEPTTVEIEDYYPHKIIQRWGGKVPVHSGIEKILSNHINSYEKLLNEFTPYFDSLSKIKFNPDKKNPTTPFWDNGFLPGLDAVVLYCIAALKKPKLYIEIGSGNSTKFLSLAKKDHDLKTRIISIDPYPRAEIDELCDSVIRKPLEECDLSIFEELEPGDILFLDGSHRVLQNSDTTVFFLEILPKIKPGVIIHIHDIMLPADYPESWDKRLYSEQYTLGALLLFAHDKFNIIMPNCYVYWCTNLTDILKPLWETPGLEKVDHNGASFWFSIK